MPQDRITAEDQKVLDVVHHISGRFERDAGFEAPGISAELIPDSVAAEFNLQKVSQEHLERLAFHGYLTRFEALPGYYTSVTRQ